MSHRGQALLQDVAERIVKRFLLSTGSVGVMFVDEEEDPDRFLGVDLVYTRAAESVKVKVKPDTYFGVDPRKIADQSLSFYRSPANAYAFETISHHVTRQAGWVFNSMADELYYYFLVIGQTEDEVAKLMDQPDDVFFSRLAVERDELHVLPMKALSEWFESHYEDYMPRPVMLGGYSAWYRIVPISDIAATSAAATIRGSIFSRVAQT